VPIVVLCFVMLAANKSFMQLVFEYDDDVNCT